MSLQIWLPFCKDGYNQGLNNNQINADNRVFNNNGKIGKCLELTNFLSLNVPQSIYDVYTVPETEISYCLWVKIDKAYLNNLISTTDFSTKKSMYNRIMGFTAGTSSSGMGFQVYTGDNLTSSTVLNTLQLYGFLRNGAIAKYSDVVEINLDEWYHLCITYDKINVLNFYINGVLVTSQTALRNSLNTSITNKILGLNAAISNLNNSSAANVHLVHLKEYFNDIRIYNHALSPKEVEEIAKGLVLHYKLNQNLNVLNNCYQYPTFFNSSSSNAGWSHWSQSGASGTYGQNTDKQFIFNKNNSYSHWIANASSATGDYLLYQAPSFNGGIRSLQVILKEENGIPINESIVYPAWNARNGGVPLYLWTSITSLEDGFYLCKCEGISQDGSNDLVGIYVRAGYKIYISEAYLENNRSICSDIFFQNNLATIYDSSGYSNHGTILGTLQAVADSPRYNIATQFDGNTSGIINEALLSNILNTNCTISFWVKDEESGSRGTIFGNYNASPPFTIEKKASNLLRVYWNNNPDLTINNTELGDNIWTFVALVKTGTNKLETYIDGVLKNTNTNTLSSLTFPNTWRIGRDTRSGDATPFKGQLSDFRIYATSFTAAQVKELYDTSMSIDSNGNIYVREFKESV